MIHPLRAEGKKDEIFVSASLCVKQKTKVIPVRDIRACEGSEGKDPGYKCD
jgi:hypothetical protein